MSQLYLMEKTGEGQMNVPAEKKADYEQNDWKVVSAPAAPAPVLPEASPAEAETPKGKNKKTQP